MDGVHLPDTVLGLGGAGKRLVFETLCQQSGDGGYWFLEELMSERNRDLGRVNFFTLDSATKEVKDDRPIVEEIDDAIDDIKEENRRNDVRNYPDVNHTYVNIGEDISRVFQNRTTFINVGEVRQRLGQTDLTHWWLGRDDLRSGMDFNEGVYRRRARSKGMYYAAKQGGQSIEEMIAAAGSEVAIVTALGGGTGSGMFIDLARELNADGVNVTLFAVVPNSEEGAERRANAHAALSELEFLQLTDQNPFAQMILLPFEPVAEKNEPKAHEEEFVEAFPYTFLSFYNLDNNAKHNTLECAGSGYHPFTVAVPQVLRYNTAHIEQAKADLDSFLDDKEELQEQEIELYDAIEEFLVDNYDEVADAVAELEDDLVSIPVESRVGPVGRNILQRRLDDLRTLTELDTFDQLDCRAPPEFRSLLSDVENPDGTVVDEIRDLEQQRNYNPPDVAEDGPDMDGQLETVLDAEIDAVVKKARVMELSERIPDTDVRDHLVRDLNRVTDADEAAGPDQLKAERSRLRTEKRKDEEKMEAVDARIDDVTDAIESELETLERTVSDAVDQLETIESRESELIEAASEVDDELETIETQINRASDPDEVKRISFDAAPAEFDALSEVGVADPPDLSRATVHLTKARAEALAHDADGDTGILDRARDWLDDTQGQHQEQYEGYARSLRGQSDEYGQIASLPAWNRRSEPVSFEIDVESAIEERIEERRIELLGEVADAYVDVVDRLTENEDLDESARSSLSDVSPSVGSVRGMVDHEEPLLDRIEATLTDAALGDARTRREELESEIERKEAGIETYGNALEFYMEHNDVTGYAADESALRDRLGDIGVDDSDDRLDDDFRYVRRKDPREVHQLLGNRDIRSDEFWSEERGEIREAVENEFIGRNVLQSTKFLGLNKTDNDLASDDRTSAQSGYDEHRIFPVFMSRMFEEGRNVDFDIRREFTEGEGITFNLEGTQESENDTYRENVVQNGGPWDIGVTVFVGGVFLDNLKAMKRNGSLPGAYDYQSSNGSDPIRLHHSWGLGGEDRSGRHDCDGGIYVRRTGTMNLSATQADDPSVRLDVPAVRFINDTSDGEIGESILSEFYDVQDFTLDHEYNTGRGDD